MFLLALINYSILVPWLCTNRAGVGISHLIATGGSVWGTALRHGAYEHQEEVATMPSSRAYADTCSHI